jgi:hypothetical protein
MIAAFKAFFTTHALRVAGWCMAALSALGILLAARRAGRNAERVDALEKQSENVSKSHEIQDKNRRTLADGDAAKRLRDDWSRD